MQGSTSVPEVIPSWIHLWHAVGGVLGTAGIAKSTAAAGVDGDEHNEDDGVEDGDVVPASPHLLQHSGLARVALVAQDAGGVVPPVAVLLVLRLRLHGHAALVVRARRRWLAAPRLYWRQAMLQVIHGRPSRDPGARSGPNHACQRRPPVAVDLDALLQPGRVISDPELLVGQALACRRPPP